MDRLVATGSINFSFNTFRDLLSWEVQCVRASVIWSTVYQSSDVRSEYSSVLCGADLFKMSVSRIFDLVNTSRTFLCFKTHLSRTDISRFQSFYSSFLSFSATIWRPRICSNDLPTVFTPVGDESCESLCRIWLFRAVNRSNRHSIYYGRWREVEDCP